MRSVAMFGSAAITWMKLRIIMNNQIKAAHFIIRFILGVVTPLELAFLCWALDAPHGAESVQQLLAGVVAVILMAGAVRMTAVVAKGVPCV